MKKNLLERHLKAEHSRYVDKDEEFFQQKLDAVNACKLDVSGAVFKSNSAALVEASYMVAYTVAKAKKPHTIAEELVLPCTKYIVSLVSGKSTSRNCLFLIIQFRGESVIFLNK